MKNRPLEWKYTKTYKLLLIVFSAMSVGVPAIALLFALAQKMMGG